MSVSYKFPYAMLVQILITFQACAGQQLVNIPASAKQC